MSNQNGWIKLYRKFRDNPIYTNSRAVHVWVECLMRATHADEKTFFLKREKVVLNSGQFLMGRSEFGKTIGMSGSTAWFWLLQFESDNMLDIKKTTKGSIVTIKNWNEYQTVDIKVDKGKTTDEQRMNTNKNVKNDKNVILGKYVKLTKSDYERLCSDFGKEIIANAVDEIELWLPNSKRSKTGYKDYNTAIRGWLKRAGKEKVSTPPNWDKLTDNERLNLAFRDASLLPVLEKTNPVEYQAIMSARNY